MGDGNTAITDTMTLAEAGFVDGQHVRVKVEGR